MKDPTFTEQVARLMVATGTKNEAALAAALGLSPQAIYSAKKRGGRVPASWIVAATERFDVSADWLLYGTEAEPNKLEAKYNKSYIAGSPLSPPPHENVRPVTMAKVPVIGLASCGGHHGWSTPMKIAIPCPIPAEEAAPNMFAVIAVGNSMVPEGIKPGYVALCDPDLPPTKGDAVYVAVRNPTDKTLTVSLKKYVGQDDKWLNLQGWLDPKGDDPQTPFVEQLAIETVERIAVVCMVKRKA